MSRSSIPAMRLYRRLGFATEEDKGVYDLMRWSAAARATALRDESAVAFYVNTA